MKSLVVLLPLLLMAPSCPPPNPTPTPTPTVPPTLTCANIDCIPGSHCVDTSSGPKCVQETPPPPVVSKCPVPIPLSARYINRKPYGQGWDSTPRVRDKAYCEKMTGIEGVTDCKANPEGSGQDVCDEEFLGQPCPTWQAYYGGQWNFCHPANGEITCDHYDHWNEQGSYSGICQKFPNGSPSGGFFMIAHGKGKVRACDKTASVCSEPIEVDY
jgi:hypothetical protein